MIISGIDVRNMYISLSLVENNKFRRICIVGALCLGNIEVYKNIISLSLSLSLGKLEIMMIQMQNVCENLTLFHTDLHRFQHSNF